MNERATYYGSDREAEDAMAVMARWISRNRKIQVKYHNGSAVDADVQKGVIRIPRMACASGITQEALMLLRGRVYHEAGHIDETVTVPREDYPKPLADGRKSPLFEIWNALEDRRMEAVEADKHAGCKVVFDWLTKYFNKEIAKKVSSGQVDAPLWEALVAMSFLVEGCQPAWSPSKKAKAYIDAAYDEFCKVKSCRNDRESLELAEKIHKILKEKNDELKKDEPKPQKGQKGKKGEKGEKSEKGEPGEPQAGGTGDFEDEESDEGEESEGSGSKKDGKDSKAKKDEKKSKDDGEKKEDGKDNGEGEGDDDKDEKGNKDGSASDGDEEDDDEEGKGSAGGSDGEEDEEEEDEEDGEEGDGDGKDEGEGSAEGADGEGDEKGSEAGGKGEGKGGDKGDAEGKSEGEGDDAKGDVKPGDTPYEMKDEEAQGGAGAKDDRSLEDEISGVTNEEIANEELSKFFDDLDPADLEYMSRRDLDDHIVPNVSDAGKATYKERREMVSVMVASMTHALEQALRSLSKSRKKPYLRHGRLDKRRLVAIAKGLSKEVFYKTREGMELDVAAAITIDESGSMGNYVHVQLLAIAIGEALNAIRVPFEIIGTTTRYSGGDTRMPEMDGFTRVNPIVYKHYKNFNDKWDVVRSRIVQTGAHEHNVDGEVIEYAAFRLAQREESRKIVFSLSDGQPCGGHGNDEDMAKNLKRVCKRVRKEGIEVYGFGIGTQGPEGLYGKEWFVYLETPAQMGPGFVKKFADVVTGGKFRV